jgi:hypothetical protein
LRSKNKVAFAALAALLAPAVLGSHALADSPSPSQPIPTIVSGGGTITRTVDAAGRPAVQIELPVVNADHPVSEVTIGTGADQITLRTWLVSSVPVGGSKGSSAPMSWSNNCSGSNPGYCTCISQMSRGFHPAYTEMNLQTSWNYDYSTVWTNIGQGNWHSADFPLWFNDITMWTSGGGTVYAYSDLTAEVMDGIGWFSVHVGNYHMWHQIDAWANCHPYATWS